MPILQSQKTMMMARQGSKFISVIKSQYHPSYIIYIMFISYMAGSNNPGHGERLIASDLIKLLWMMGTCLF